MASITRREFLGSTAGAAAALSLGSLGRTARAATGPARNLVIVFNSGGWDTTYGLEVKPGLSTIDVPSGAQKSFGNIPIWSDPTRPNVDAFFTAYGSLSAVVNGIFVRGISHPACQKRILTGTASETNPDLGMIASYELGRSLPVPYLVLGDIAFTGPLAAAAGRVGTTNQIVTLLSSSDAYPAPAGSSWSQPTFSPSGSDETSIRAFIEARVARERATVGSEGYNKARIDDFEASLTRGDLLKSYRAYMGTRGRTIALANQVPLAVNALQNGIAWAVMLDSRLTWDTHTNNALQNPDWDTSWAGVKLLADQLAAAPGKASGSTLLDETVVCVISEMSRTPKLNGALGKDHWPVTSCVVFGSGVRGNQVIGGTDNTLSALAVDYSSGRVSTAGTQMLTDNVIAGVLQLCGVDSTKYLPTSEPVRAFIA